MKSTSVLVTTLALLAAPALANAQPHFTITNPTAQGDCGGGVEANITTLDGMPSLDLIFPNLSAVTDDVTRQARRLCNVRVLVKAERGYRLQLRKVFYQGKVDIDGGRGSGGNVSARGFFQGLPGIDGFERFSAGEARNFTVNAEEGTADTSCGAETYMNMLVDVSARELPGNDSISEVAIQRGVGRPGAVIRCGIRVTRCP